MTIEAVCTELASVVEAATGLTTLDHIPITPASPSAYVGFPTVPSFDDGATGDGAIRFTVPVTFVVAIGSPASAQQTLKAGLRTARSGIDAHTGTAWKSARCVSSTTPKLTADDRLTFDLIVSIHAQL
jgi:hypothetical protein